MKLKANRIRVARTAKALLPHQVAKAYNFPENVDVSKRTVAVLELGGAYKDSDVFAYCERNGYKKPQLSSIMVDGMTMQSSEADGEVCLDVDVIAGVAQGCKIVVVFAPNSAQGFIDGVKKCVSINPDAISISWGGPEDTYSTHERVELDALFKQAAEKGIAVFAASGDNGSSDGEIWGNHVDYPASSPYVVACGGTYLEVNPDGTRLLERVWTNGGGGISKYYPTPDWQSSTLLHAAKGRRVPDLSGNADPASGFQVDINGFIQQIGGTSAVAPFMAAYQLILNAIAGKHVGNFHTKIQTHAACFYDVRTGSNGGFSASQGFDCCTGWGVMDGHAFAKAVNGPSVPHVEKLPAETLDILVEDTEAVDSSVKVEPAKVKKSPKS